MYSNARLSKASAPVSRNAPARSSLDMFEVGTTRPALNTFSPHTAIPRHKQKARLPFDSS